MAVPVVLCIFLKKNPFKNQKNFPGGGLRPPAPPASACAARCRQPPKLAALRRGARREKNSFVKSKNFKKVSKLFFPPRRQATLSWLGGLRLHATGMKVTRSLAFAL